MYTDLALYIEGKWLDGEGRDGEDVINPATGKPLGRLPHASRARSRSCARCGAGRGSNKWRATSAYDRAKVLREAGGQLGVRADAHRPHPHARSGAGAFAEIARQKTGVSADMHRMVRRGRSPRLWAHRAGAGERHAPARRAGGGRNRGGVHAVGFSPR